MPESGNSSATAMMLRQQGHIVPLDPEEDPLDVPALEVQQRSSGCLAELAPSTRLADDPGGPSWPSLRQSASSPQAVQGSPSSRRPGEIGENRDGARA
jgi:hypothetical protein